MFLLKWYVNMSTGSPIVDGCHMRGTGGGGVMLGPVIMGGGGGG